MNREENAPSARCPGTSDEGRRAGDSGGRPRAGGLAPHAQSPADSAAPPASAAKPPVSCRGCLLRPASRLGFEGHSCRIIGILGASSKASRKAVESGPSGALLLSRSKWAPLPFGQKCEAPAEEAPFRTSLPRTSPSLCNYRRLPWAPKAAGRALLPPPPPTPPRNSPSENLFQEVAQHAGRVWCPESFITMLFLTAKYQRAPTRSAVRDSGVHRGTAE